MHLGVTLEFSKPVVLETGTLGTRTWRFLTLEMMTNGMMWTLTEASEPTQDYDYQQKFQNTFDSLSPRVVARYIAAQRGRRYLLGATDCQTGALELGHRCLLHGGPSSQVFQDLHTGRFSTRFIVILSAAVLTASGLAVAAARLRRKWKLEDASARFPFRATATVVVLALLARSCFAAGSLMVLPLGASYCYHRRKGHNGPQYVSTLAVSTGLSAVQKNIERTRPLWPTCGAAWGHAELITRQCRA